MMGPIQIRLVELLRSGRYKQHKGALHNPAASAFDVLGIACKAAGYKIGKQTRCFPFERKGKKALPHMTVLPGKVFAQIGLYNAVGIHHSDKLDSLVHRNDIGTSFPEIADIIESNPRKWFRAAA